MCLYLGRYQIVMSATERNPFPIRIDRLTGRTWILHRAQDGWVEIGDAEEINARVEKAKNEYIEKRVKEEKMKRNIPEGERLPIDLMFDIVMESSSITK